MLLEVGAHGCVQMPPLELRRVLVLEKGDQRRYWVGWLVRGNARDRQREKRLQLVLLEVGARSLGSIALEHDARALRGRRCSGVQALAWCEV